MEVNEYAETGIVTGMNDFDERSISSEWDRCVYSASTVYALLPHGTLHRRRAIIKSKSPRITNLV